MIFGTDLAIERREITNSGKNDGVTVKKRRVKSASVTEIEITTDAGAEKLGRPVGTYVTVELPPFSSEFDDADSRMLAVRDEIKKLLPKNTSGVLVVGLGNSDITPRRSRSQDRKRYIFDAPYHKIARRGGGASVSSACIVRFSGSARSDRHRKRRDDSRNNE